MHKKTGRSQSWQETHLVLATREEIWMTGRHRETTYSGDVARERQPQLTRRKVPNLDNTIPCTRGEPLVSRLDGNAADPSQMSRNDAYKFPWCVIFWLDGTRSFVQRERLGEF